MKKIIILLLALLMSACSAVKPSEGMKELFPEQHGVDDDSFEEEETEQA